MVQFIRMKKIKCLDCEEEFMGGSKEEVLNLMHPHYMKAHADIMAAGNEESKKAWFEKFDASWEAAEAM